MRSQAASSLATRSPFSLSLWWAEFQMDICAHAQRRRGRVHFADLPSATPTRMDFDERHGVWQCPACGGAMHVVERLSAKQILREQSHRVCILDSS